MPSKLIRLAIVVLLLFVAALTPVRAIPAFAKAHKMSCSSCHAYYPRLNDFGEQFRRDGYQLPGGVKVVTVGSQGQFPASVEVSTRSWSSDGMPTRHAAAGYLLSGGVIARDVSFFTQYPMYSTSYRGLYDEPARLQSASVLFNDLAQSGFGVRAGRFIPACDAFGPSHHMILDGTRTIYASPSDYSDGVEISKFGAAGMSYYAGRAEWAPPTTRSLPLHGYYVRVAKAFGGGLGQTKGHSIGLVGFAGETSRQVQIRAPGWAPVQDQRVAQMSADASLNFGRADLSLQRIGGAYEGGERLWGIDYAVTSAQLAYSASRNWVCALSLGSSELEYPRGEDQHTDQYKLIAGYYPNRNVGLNAYYGLYRARMTRGLEALQLAGHSVGLGLDLCY